MEQSFLLPDQHHIELIRKRLWSNREHGNVSIMVGSGLSLNADKISDNSNPFLLWGELIERMKHGLYPYETTETGYATSDALKLASEYELVFGRKALEDLLVEALPDDNYVPGRLHKLLLSLPWSDVFTTNYDTLLERTLPFIHEKKYDVVLTPSDLPGQTKPRIIKLHGSFPSHRPFIINEEDYRTYPDKFSSFVNTVQQSVMENIFCLIGFSGDDPNFLKWIGWVRDNLGDNTQPIYFIGFVNPTQKRILESRGIIPINLSPLFPHSKYPGILKHQKALEWILLNLQNGKKPDVLKWPSHSSNYNEQREDLPFIPPGPAPYVENIDFRFIGDKLSKDQLLKIYDNWRKKREEYPGWLVAPKHSRDQIWRHTDFLISPILNSLNELNFDEQLHLLYELNWRLEVSLRPLYIHWVEKITPIINSINPFSKELKEKLHPNNLDQKVNQNIDWYQVQIHWVELIFSLAREAREDHDEDRFNIWMEKIKEIANSRLEWTAKWYYEKCLFYLNNFDQKELRGTLENWPETDQFPFWEVRRASLLAELGKIKEAEKIVEASLSNIRLRIKANQVDYSLLSQEGWAMVLLKALNDNNYNSESSSQYTERWAKLSNYRCNPWQEIEVTSSILKSSVPNHTPPRRVTKNFDPGMITTHLSIGQLNTEEVHLAFSFLKMFEDAGIPIRFGSMGMFTKEVVNAAKWIEPFAPLWALSSTIRAGKTKEIAAWFDRVRVAKLTEEEVNHFYNIFIPSLEQALENNSNSSYNFLWGHKNNLLEIVSRICFRFSSAQLKKIMEISVELYQLEEFRNISDSKQVNLLFKRVLFAMSDEEKVLFLPIILRLPLEVGERFQDKLIDPSNYIIWSDNFRLDPSFQRGQWVEDIEKLLSITEGHTGFAREKAILRLIKVYQIGGLTEIEKKRFANALWAQIDGLTGLPSSKGLYDFSYLHLPEPSEGLAKEKLRNYLINQDLPRILNRKMDSEGKEVISYSGASNFEKLIINWLESTKPIFTNDKNSKLYIDWESDQAIVNLIDMVINCWEKEKKDILNWNNSRFGDSPKDQINMLIRLLERIILPNINIEAKDSKIKVTNLLKDLSEEGFNVNSVLPFTINLGLYSSEEVEKKLSLGFISMNKDIMKSSLKGVVYWLVYAKEGKLPTLPMNLLNEWVHKIYSRRQPCLSNAIEYMILLIDCHPDVLDEKHKEMLYNALEFLLVETDLGMMDDKDKLTALQFSIEDFPEYRSISSDLAYSLYSLCKKNSIDMPEILVNSKKIFEDDPLPEVSHRWK